MHIQNKRGRREVSQGCQKVFTCRSEHKGISSIPRHRFSEAGVAQWICCHRLFKVKLCHIYPLAMSVQVTPPGPDSTASLCKACPAVQGGYPSYVRKQVPAYILFRRAREIRGIANDLEARMTEAGSLSLPTPSKLVRGTFSKSPSLCVSVFPLNTCLHT